MPHLAARHLAVCAAILAGGLTAQAEYRKDVDFALEELEKQCGHFFKQKGIKWSRVAKEMKKAAKKVKTDQDHLVLLTRLIARLEDGHARVRPTDATKDVRWPDGPWTNLTGPGMSWCRVGKKVYVKTSWATAKEVGVEPGMEVLKVDGMAVGKWLDNRTKDAADVYSFSTPHHADFFVLNAGLMQPKGSRMKLEVRTADGKSKKNRTLTYGGKVSGRAVGPSQPPSGAQQHKDLVWAKTEAGNGYVHVRRCKSDLPEQIDHVLAELGDVPGMILDFRANSGGGFDHDALFGRFVPTGKTVAFAKRYASAGPRPYGGPVVVIVDATCVSAGETGSGMFKEDGRAYMIGESPTAGMSSSKTTIDLPSGKFQLYVSIRSNKARFNKGKGIEGIGVLPHEIVSFDPKDLAAGRDTLIQRAEAVLADFPQNDVPYVPARFGWK